jgi:hypothetical protein
MNEWRQAAGDSHLPEFPTLTIVGKISSSLPKRVSQGISCSISSGNPYSFQSPNHLIPIAAIFWLLSQKALMPNPLENG